MSASRMANSKRHATLAPAVPEVGAATARLSNEAQPHARVPILRRKLLERTGFHDEDFSIHYKATGYLIFFLPTYLFHPGRLH